MSTITHHTIDRRFSVRKALIATCLLAALIVASIWIKQVSAANITVPVGGDITAAINNAKAGDVVILAKGTHRINSMSIANKNGTKTAPITVRGAEQCDAIKNDSCTTIIEPTSSSSGRFIEVNASYINFEDFAVYGQSDIRREELPTDINKVAQFKDQNTGRAKPNASVMYIGVKEGTTRNSSVNLNRMHISGGGTECVHYSAMSDSEVKNSVIRHCGLYKKDAGYHNGESIYLGQSPNIGVDAAAAAANNIKITNNRLWSYGSECVNIKENSSNNTIQGNDCRYAMEDAPAASANNSNMEIQGYDNNIIGNYFGNSLGVAFKTKVDGEGRSGNNNVKGNYMTGYGLAAFELRNGPQGVFCGNLLDGAKTVFNQGQNFISGNKDPQATCTDGTKTATNNTGVVTTSFPGGGPVDPGPPELCQGSDTIPTDIPTQNITKTVNVSVPKSGNYRALVWVGGNTQSGYKMIAKAGNCQYHMNSDARVASWASTDKEDMFTLDAGQTTFTITAPANGVVLPTILKVWLTTNLDCEPIGPEDMNNGICEKVTPPPTGNGVVTLAGGGDWGDDWGSGKITTSSMTNAAKHDVILLAGDLSYAGISGPEGANKWCTAANTIAKNIPFVFTPGDHDTKDQDGDVPTYAECLNKGKPASKLGQRVMPNNDPNAFPYLYYVDAVDDGAKVRIIASSAGFLQDGTSAGVAEASKKYADLYSKGSENYNFIENAARDARAKGMWVVNINHLPCVDMGKNYDTNSKFKYCQDFVNLGSKAFDLSMTGSSHNAWRTHQLTTSVTCPNIALDPPAKADAKCITQPKTGTTNYHYGQGYINIHAGAAGKSTASSAQNSEGNCKDSEASVYTVACLTSGVAGIVSLTATPTSLSGKYILAADSSEKSEYAFSISKTNDPNDPCQSDPTKSGCACDPSKGANMPQTCANFCKVNPKHESCVSVDPCQSDPTKSGCACDPSKGANMPQTCANFCKVNPKHESCVSVDPCQSDPTKSGCACDPSKGANMPQTCANFCKVNPREAPCVDKDSDGIKDAYDNCPDKAGPSSNKGCPIDGGGNLGGSINESFSNKSSIDNFKVISGRKYGHESDDGGLYKLADTKNGVRNISIHNTYLGKDYMVSVNGYAKSSSKTDSLYLYYDYKDDKNYSYVSFSEDKKDKNAGIFIVSNGNVRKVSSLVQDVKSGKFQILSVELKGKKAIVKIGNKIVGEANERLSSDKNGVGVGSINSSLRIDSMNAKSI